MRSRKSDRSGLRSAPKQLLDVRDNVLDCTKSSQVVYSVCPPKKGNGDVEYLHGLLSVPKGTLQ